MKKNMGNADKTLRIMSAIVIAALYFTNVISGTAAIILGIIALAFVLTSLMGFCPLYFPFNISTTKNKN
ncbi:YgaP family membrane protein [Pedobacter sp. ASV12]|uniref:YgaP family membrane protein n=1 Tax=Pedobacter sp. ASV12 TaxID=2795120 RepID=UPI0018ECE338|nr:DUF2892 domain-containing protein [Pedobacter sp. ASV12]